MKNEDLKAAFIALRDAVDVIINSIETNQTKTETKKYDSTVSEFWQALKIKDFNKAKILYKQFSESAKTEKQMNLKTRMKNALVERYEQEQRKNETIDWL